MVNKHTQNQPSGGTFNFDYLIASHCCSKQIDIERTIAVRRLAIPIIRIDFLLLKLNFRPFE